MTKLNVLTSWFKDKNSCMVSLSGGVDSALVAYAAHTTLGNNSIAVTADYKTLSQEELKSSKQICKEIGIKQIIIEYDELENENFVINDNTRCFHCRTELATHLRTVADENHIDVIVDGTNVDDMQEYRPGIAAMKDGLIQSPLLDTGFTKKDVRTTAKQVGLSIHDRPSNSCLASRIPWGQRINNEQLLRIDLGETMIKQVVQVKQLRVRDLGGNARIDMDLDDLCLLSDAKKNIISTKLKMLGFKTVSFNSKGYSTGNVNVV